MATNRFEEYVSGVFAAVLNAGKNAFNVQTYTARNSGILHREGVIAADVLAAPNNPSLSGQTITSGSLTSGTTYYVGICARNKYGNTPINAAIQSASPGGSNNALRVPINQVAGATHYDIFLSTDAAPKHVLGITEAQRAAGGVCTTVETYATGGTAGAIDVGVAGTGIQTNNSTVFTASMFAWNVESDSIDEIACAGYRFLRYGVKCTLDDLRAVPTTAISVFLKNKNGDWLQLNTTNIAYTTAFYKEGASAVDVGGAVAAKILLYGIAGQGASVDVWVELHS